MAVTIQHLEVRFDVEANEEEAAFVRLFQKYNGQFVRQQQEQQDAADASERDRALGDRTEV